MRPGAGERAELREGDKLKADGRGNGGRGGRGGRGAGEDGAAVPQGGE